MLPGLASGRITPGCQAVGRLRVRSCRGSLRRLQPWSPSARPGSSGRRGAHLGLLAAVEERDLECRRSPLRRKAASTRYRHDEESGRRCQRADRTTGALLPTYAAAGRCGVIENPKRRKSVSRSGIGHVVARTRQGPKRSRGETDRRWRRAVVALFRGLARFDLRLWRTRKPARWTLDGRYCTMYHGDRCVHQKMFSSLTQFAATPPRFGSPKTFKAAPQEGPSIDHRPGLGLGGRPSGTNGQVAETQLGAGLLGPL